MIIYKPCSEVTISQIFEAFQLGFSDYISPVKMEEEVFQAQFFGPEGNQYDISYIAFDGIHPIGLILSGIRLFDGVKTMRCGALCIAPNYRGKKISDELLKLHQEAAISRGCKQLFLEVITENHRAISFYRKHGYREATIMKYYSNPVDNIPVVANPSYSFIVTINYNIIKRTRDCLTSCHINWQSDTPYYENNSKDLYLGIYEDDKLVATLAATPRGKINFLWVEPKYRMKGLANNLLLEAAKQLEAPKLTVCISSNALLEGFFRKMQFTKENIEQYEMYLPL